MPNGTSSCACFLKNNLIQAPLVEVGICLPSWPHGSTCSLQAPPGLALGPRTGLYSRGASSRLAQHLLVAICLLTLPLESPWAGKQEVTRTPPRAGCQLLNLLSSGADPPPSASLLHIVETRSLLVDLQPGNQSHI